MIRRIARSAVDAATTKSLLSTVPRYRLENPELLESVQSASALRSGVVASHVTSGVLGAEGNHGILRVHGNIGGIDRYRLLFQIRESHGTKNSRSLFSRTFASRASDKQGRSATEAKKEISTVEDPFDSPTYHIPEKPVTFVEGASYSVIILAGLGVAAAAAYAVFSELIFQPKEYKVYNMALKRIQDDSQVRIRIGSPITGYGQESRNRAARQRIPHRIWTDEDGVEQIEVNFYIRGPHGAGKVFCWMFKDNADRQWKFTSLIVQIMSPSPAQLLLESYVPA